MSTVPQDSAPWEELRKTLAGSFAARARGLLASDFALLDRGGREVGRLRVRGTEGAQLEAGDLEAEIRRTAPRRYEMLTGGARTLSAEAAASAVAMEIRCADHLYEARLSLLRNTAEAIQAAGGGAVRLSGGLTNRGYEAVFEVGDEGSLPVAIFLLYRIVALRRGAYRTGVGEAERAGPGRLPS